MNIRSGGPIQISDEKIIEIVAGPNGSGKTTFAESYFEKTEGESVFLNPDVIAAGIAPLDFEKASFHAGRVLIEEIKRRIERKERFGFESTLSGRTWLPILKQAVQDGYRIKIYFIYLSSIQKNLSRIEKRVSFGGHPIPTEAVHRRHPRCFENFWSLYRPLCDEWYTFDNSGRKPKLLLKKSSFELLSQKEQQRFLNLFLKGRIYDRKGK